VLRYSTLFPQTEQDIHAARFRSSRFVCCCLVFTASAEIAAASTLCVNAAGSNGCYTTIRAAVHHASPNDVIEVEAGMHKEEVVIAIPLSIVGAGADASILDATGLAHGIFVDGFAHPGLNNVIIAKVGVRNALFEGILVASASDVTIRNNQVVDNDRSSGLKFTGAPMGFTGQPGNKIYEKKPATAVVQFT
jgi:hypothetical protein